MATVVPTWQYVRDVISDNIDKASLAASAAERGLEELRSSITSLPFSQIDTVVDAGLTWRPVSPHGETVSISWGDLPTIAEPVNLEWTATVTTPTDPTEPDYSGETFPTVEVPDVSVPAGIVGPADVQFTDPSGTAPVMGARIFSTAPTGATTTPIGLGAPASLPDVAGEMKALLAAETGGFSSDTGLTSAMGAFADGLGTANTDAGHPWGAAWESSAYQAMRQRADEVRDQLHTILTDPSTQGLPSSYWDRLATEALARIARKKVGALRRAQNGGAASYWGLPTEAVLSLTQRAEQDASEEYRAIEGEIVKKRTELVREAYFKAIDVLVDMERWMVTTAQAVKKQAVDTLNTVFGMRVAMYNANLAQFKYVFDRVQTSIDALTTDNKMALEAWGNRLRAMEAELRADETTANIFSTEMSGYKIGRETHFDGIDAQVRLWSAKTEGVARFEGLKQEKAKTDIAYFGAVVDRVQAIASATASLLSARSTAQNARVEAEKSAVNLDVAKNTAAIERAKLVQDARQSEGQLTVQGDTARNNTEIERFKALLSTWSSQAELDLDLDKAQNQARLDNARIRQQAQQADSALEVSQAQYVTSQTNAVLQAIAASYVGIYQALLQVSDVKLGSSADYNYQESASKNQEKVWD